jgi:outer membrane protein assembly factor BamB
MYGVNPQHTGVARSNVRPPFRTAWSFQAGSLIEFPPVIAYGRLYFGTNGGRFLALDALNGRVVWERDFGRCIAASAAVAGGVVFVPLMDPSPCARHDERAAGFLLALDAMSGHLLWRFRAGPVESSPLVAGGSVYFGSWDRHVYSLAARTGRLLWSFETGEKVKGGPALAGRTIFIGSYDGGLYALDVRNGRLRWRADVGSSVYATPVVAGGLVLVSGLDGTIEAFRTADGRRVWSRETGSFVYSSAAVRKDTVYVGSYDHRLFALDLSTGRTRWAFTAAGPISGTPTIVGGIVYVASCAICIAGVTRAGPQRTYGVAAQSGKLVWSAERGDYTPVVADADRAYLIGYSRLLALVPTRTTR